MLLIAFCPISALAEIPRTTAEWLAVYKERQARFDAVEIESHWQRLEGEKVVEEWDQTFYGDDLGRLRLEERGRLRRDTKRDGVGILSDATYAFDGAEYRELEKRWEYAFVRGIASKGPADILRTPPRGTQGRIEAEPGEHSEIHRAETPLKWSDYWMLVCVTNAEKERLEPRVVRVSHQPEVWEVTFESKVADWGHSCKAWFSPEQDNHVVRIDMQGDGKWAGRYETRYSNRDGSWFPSWGSYDQLTMAARHLGQQHALSLRFSVREARQGVRRGEQAYLPEFPDGTWVADLRTKAAYRVGQENEFDRRTERLLAKARPMHVSFVNARTEAAQWPGRLALLAKCVTAGLVLGVAMSDVWSVAAKYVFPIKKE